jgi:Inner membrane protein YgaP-like, transmembrane domain
MKLQHNVGTPDRAIRIVIAALLAMAVAGGLVTAPISYLAGIVAAILFVTGLVGFCPLYAILRVSTSPRRA